MRVLKRIILLRSVRSKAWERQMFLNMNPILEAYEAGMPTWACKFHSNIEEWKYSEGGE